MGLSCQEILSMMDFSTVRAESDINDVRLMAEKALEYEPAAVFALAGWTAQLKEMLAEKPGIAIGGVVGFPAGGETTAAKVFQAKELIEIGCDELDMVINVGKLRSGMYAEVEEDVLAVVDAAGGIGVKVIFECGHLSDDDIRKACEICVKAGVRFVKTGTGWADCSRIREYVSLMKSCVGDEVGVKAAGGIRDLEMLADLYDRGARRFGVGVSSAINILGQCEQASK